VVEKNGEMVPVNVMKRGTTFGEMSFINIKENGEYNASATVIAKGEVELSVIQGYFINILFSMHAGFEIRFFEYLCDILAQRINKQTQNLGSK
jgi:CRP-like cAMP-binding protein